MLSDLTAAYPSCLFLLLAQKSIEIDFYFFFNEQIIPVFIKNGTLLLDFGSI